MSYETVPEVCNVYIRVKDGAKDLMFIPGHNVWTNIGREYSCLLKSYNRLGQPYRSDRIAYVGLGQGTQIEVPSVTSLVDPIAWSPQVFLKRIDFGLTTHPDAGIRTSIRYHCRFPTGTFGDNLQFVSECGLFTDGDALSFQQGARNVSFDSAKQQSPIAYHTFDPIPVSPNIELEIAWELRH